MDQRAQSRALRIAEELLFLAAALCAPVEALAQSSLCAVVKLEIQQQATLEREGFDAHLNISNNLPDQPLSSLKVQIFFKDANGNPADSDFFVKVATLTGTNAVDGTGVVQSSSTADIHWLIIPSSGTGGQNPAGQRYAVSALITGLSNGAPQSVQTFDAFITVHPQPLIKLEYALPYEVFGDEPLTAAIEPIEPFPLAVRVTNVGYGTARDFQIQSAQPKIVDNKQGLQVDFKLLGTHVSTQTIPNTLLIPFGDVAPGGVAQGWWVMSTTLSGRFISFTSTFTHAADLGGDLTSLMQSIHTYTLLKDVLVDLPGRDQNPDFLVNESMDRESMQGLLDAGGTPPAEYVLESDQPQPLPVTDIPATLSGALGGTSASLTLSFAANVSSNVWVRASAPFPYNGAQLAGARRSDGKVLSAANVWLSKHFNKTTTSDVWRVNVFDLTSAATSYTLLFAPGGLDQPPGAVSDLSAAADARGGALDLSWSAPGEDGQSGYLFGGHYFLDAQESTAAFSPSSSQVNFTTSTPAGAAQSYAETGLIGNATYYVALFTQDTGGNMSALSNIATAYALPNPPAALSFSSVTAVSVDVSWAVGNNRLPVVYQLLASTSEGGVAVSSSPYFDSFTSSYTFTGLLPDTTYYFSGVGENPQTGAASAPAFLGRVKTSTGTAPLPPYPAALVSQLTLDGAAGGLAIGEYGDFLYVSEPALGQVERLTLDGRVQDKWGGFGASGPGELGATETEGVSVADPADGKLLRFDPRGTLLRTFADTFSSMRGVALDLNDGEEFVADEAGGAVRDFGPGGRPLGAVLGAPFVTAPRGLAVSLDDVLYVVDGAGKEVVEEDPDGTIWGFGEGLQDPDRIALGPGGLICVSDRADHAVHVFDSSGTALGVIGGAGRGALDFGSVAGLAFDPAGRLYVANADQLLVLTVGTPPAGGAPVLGSLTVNAASPWAGDVDLTAPTPAAAFYDLRVSQTPIQTDADFAAAQPVPVAGLPSDPGTLDELRVPGLLPGTTVYVGLKAYDAYGRASNLAAVTLVAGRSVQKGQLVTVAGHADVSWLGDGWPATQAGFFFARGLTKDAAGNLYITDEDGGVHPDHLSRIRKIDAATAVMTTYAGGRNGFSGDGGPAAQAAFGNPRGLAADAQGDLFVADHDNNRIRKIDPSGIVTTVAGDGNPGFSGDGGQALAAELNGPFFMIVDGSGNPIFADAGNNRVRKIDMKTGIITTLAGNGQAGSSGDGGPATQASLDFDVDVALMVDAAGDLYIAEFGGSRIRKVDGKTGIITTVAGDGTDASTGDGGPASAAQVAAPIGVAVDPVGDVYFSEGDGERIRRIDAVSGIVTTVAGDGGAGDYGEDGPAAAAQLNGPADLYLDAKAGVLYAGDVGNRRVVALGLDPFLTAQSTVSVAGTPEATATSTAPFTVTQISSASQAGALLLSTAAAAGLTPVGDMFLVSPSSAPGAPVELTFTFDPVGVDTRTVALYHFDGVSWSSSVVFNQSLTLLDNGLYQLTGEALLTSPFGVFASQSTDTLPPRTTLSAGQPSLPGTPLYATQTTTFTLTAVDDGQTVGDGAGDGVARTWIAVDSSVFSAYAGAFSLTGEGAHTVSYYSVDVLGHAETERTVTVAVDSTPPVGELQAVGAQDAGGGLIEPAGAAVRANDPLSAGVASGLKASYVSVDGGPYLDVTGSSAALTVGAHLLSFYSVDRLGNAQAPKTASLTVVAAGAPTPSHGFVFAYRFGGPYNAPSSVALGAGGAAIYVSDKSLYRVDEFVSSGSFVRSFGSMGSGPGQFGQYDADIGLSDPRGGQPVLWAADDRNHRLEEFSADGAFLQSLTNDSVTGAALFGYPTYVAQDAQGELYTADQLLNKVQKLDATGHQLRSVTVPGSVGLLGLAVAADGSVYVGAYNQGYSVRKYDANLVFVSSWTVPNGHGLDTDAYGDLYVAAESLVDVYTSTGGLITTFGDVAPAGSALRGAIDVSVDTAATRVYVLDYDGVKVFDPDLAVPAPPALLTPLAGATLRTFTPLLAGTAQPYSVVTAVDETGAVAASTAAAADGSFVMTTAALAKGRHTLTLTAVGRNGAVSPPAAPLGLDLEYPNGVQFSSAPASSSVSDPATGSLLVEVGVLASGDFDGDGVADVLALGYTGYSLYHGLGGGQYRQSAPVDIGHCDTGSAAAGDFNKDGRLDAAVICADGAIQLLAGDGAGGFQAPVVVSAGSYTRLVAADFNGDGALDLAAVDSSGKPWLLLGAGGGTFQAPVALATTTVGGAIVAADVDGDGNVDLVAGAEVFYGDGAGHFQAAALPTVVNGRFAPAVVGDFNGDGRKDIWLPGQIGNPFSVGYQVLLSVGARAFVALPAYSWGNGYTPDRSAAADFNRDGLLDVAMSFGNGSTSMLTGSGDGTFHAPAGYAPPVPGTQFPVAGEVVATDVTADGQPDVLFAPHYSYSPQIGFFAFLNRSGPPKTQPPAAIDDLVLTSTMTGVVSLAWTAPADDVLTGTGTVSAYVLKVATYPISNQAFAAIPPLDAVVSMPPPAAAGTRQYGALGGFDQAQDRFRGLQAGVTYYARLEAIDEVQNASLDAENPPASAAAQWADLRIATGDVTFSNGFLSDGTTPSAFVNVRLANVGPAGILYPVAYLFGSPDVSSSTAFTALNNRLLLGPGDSTTMSQALGHYPAGRWTITALASSIQAHSMKPSPELDASNDEASASVGINQAGLVDATPPGRVSDLQAQLSVTGDVALGWTAPGDDGFVGQAASYEVRYATEVPTDATFPLGVALSTPTPPQTAGSTETLLASDLPGGTTLYFALRTWDWAQNVSSMSNVASVLAPYVARSTTSVGGLPEAVFSATQPVTAVPVSTASATGVVALATASAQGLTLTSDLIELGPESTSFSPQATLVFRFSTAALAGLGLQPSDVAVYEFFAGTGWVRSPVQSLDLANDQFVVSIASLSSLFGLFTTKAVNAPVWSQLNPLPDPAYGFPSPRVWNSAVYNPASRRMIVFAGGGSGGYGILNDVWVLTNADGEGGQPQWLKLNPAGGPPPAREAHAAVYDAADNRMIVHGGYTTPGNCGGVIGDVWVLTNADGTGGAPAWTQLQPTGTAPARRFQGAAYDAADNLLIVNGGAPSGCGYGVNDTWVLTHANGLGGTPAWSQLPATTPSGFPSDSSGGSTGYDPARNVLIRAYQGGGVVTTWLLSNANGQGGTPAWSKLGVSPVPSVNDWVGRDGLYDADNGRYIFYGGGVSVASETWVLSGANGAGTPRWEKLSPTGPQPDARVWAALGYTPSSGKLVMWGGSKNSWDGTNEVWTLQNPFGPPPTLKSLAVAPSSATIFAGETQAFTALGTFSDGSVASVQTAWSSDDPAVASVDASGLATGLSAGSARITASSGSLSAQASLTIEVDATPPAFSGAQVLSDSGTWSDPATTVVSSSAGAVRVTVADPQTGLVAGSQSYSPQSGTVGWWPFDTTAGGATPDVSGAGHDGTVVGATPDAGQVGGALHFNGSSQYVALGAPGLLDGATAFTLEAWVKPDAGFTADFGDVLQAASTNDSSGNRWWIQTIIGSGAVRCGVHLYGASVNLDTLATLPSGVWSHIACAYSGDSGHMTVYIGGKPAPVSVSGSYSGAVSDAGQKLDIGRHDTGVHYFKGDIDEVRVLRTALSAAQIAADASGGPLVRLSTDAGATWSDVARSNVTTTLASGGAAPQGPYVVAAQNLPLHLYAPDGTNLVSFTAADLAGNVATSTVSIRVPTQFVAQSSVSIDGIAEFSLVSTTPFNMTLISTMSQTGSVALGTATGQGLQLVSDVFELTKADTGALAALTFTFDPAVVTDTSTLAMWRFDGIAWSSVTILDQVVTISSAGVGQVTGNLIMTSLYGLFLRDELPPRTTLSIGVPAFGAGPTYVTGATSFTLSAVDDARVVGDGKGLGAAGTFVSLDGSAYAPYAGGFTLSSEGPHTLAYYSVDRAGQAESSHTAHVAVDLTAPVTGLEVEGSSETSAQGLLSFSTAAPVALVAADPLRSGVASGVRSVSYAVDGTTSAYSAPFTLSTGTHVLSYSAVDNLGNAEALHVTTVSVHFIDVLPPRTALAAGLPRFGSGPIYVSSSTPFTLSAVDDLTTAGDGLGLGVAQTFVAVDASSFTAYAGSFTLGAAGLHTISFYSIDVLGNTERVSSVTAAVDVTAPETELSVSGGRQAPGTDSASFYASTATLYRLDAQDPIVAGVASGVSFTRWQDNAGAFLLSTAPFTLAEGSHHLAYQSEDNLGRLEVLRSTTVLVDATAPVSTATIGTPLYVSADGTDYIAPTTPISLSGYDPFASGVASGLDHIEVGVDGGAYAAYTSTLTFAEGRHTVSFRSVDRVGNVETAQTLKLESDATAPATAFALGAPSFKAADGTNYIAPTTPLSFSAVDPKLVTGENGSGVARIEISLDSGPFTTYVSSLTFAEGKHTVAYRAVDNVGNVAASQTLALESDATPPASGLALSGGHQAPGADGASFYASTDTHVLFPAADPVVQGVASGVSLTRWQDNGGPLQPVMAPIVLAEGVHQLGYQSQDNVGNLEVLHSTTALVDGTAPETELAVLGGRQFAGPDGSTFYASSATLLAFISTDPVSGGVASGLAGTRWQDNGGGFTFYTAPLALAEGAHVLAYESWDRVDNYEAPRSTNVWVDATAPVSTATIGSPLYAAADGTNFISTATPVSLAASDPALPTGQAGSGVARIEVSVDGGAFATYASALTFGEGRHTILYRAVDNVGNVEAARTLLVQADATPPVTSLVVGQPQYQLPGSLLVSSRTAFALSALDPVAAGVASGVKDTFYAIDGGSFAVYASSFSLALPDGPRTVSFYSRDNVLNVEAVKSATVLLDATPPLAALISPEPGASGICQVLKGKVTVIGSVGDAHLAGYTLDFAPGQNAASGFTAIAAGSAAISSGTLATWDTSKLSGWQTLRLTATDLVGNLSVVAENVWIGDPAELLSLGGHEVFDMPQGVAAGAAGSIYVADTNADKIEVFSSTGTLLAAFGDGRHDKDKDGDGLDVSTAARFSKPRGVAVDGAGDLFVADTQNNRVVELSSAGQVLLELGNAQVKREGDRVIKKGALPGQFFQPSGVAVSAAGDVYVADTGNHRVQVLSSTGAVKLVFALPPAGTAAKGDEDDDGPDDSLLGKPFGIAVDAAGKIYVADPKGHRALVYGADGALLLTIPIAGSQPDGDVVAGEPQGIAVSPNGDCILVSDRKLDRVVKFDALGNQLLSFGTRGHIPEGQAPPASVVFDKPIGLSFAADGTLLVADRNNDRVERFGAPNGQSTLVVPAPQKPGDDLAKDVLDQDAGGEVKRADDAGVKIPAGALPQDLQISVSTVTPADESQVARMAQKAADSGLKPAYAPVDYGPEGTHFASSVTLTIPYNPQLVADQGIDEEALQVHYWNPAKGDWEALPSEVDTVNHVVKAKTGHFSLYQVLGSSGASTQSLRPQALADPTFTFRDLYAFPNPAARGKNPTIRLQVGVADEVDIRFYDVSGQQVGSASLTQPPVVLDDGNGKGPQYTYDYRWDTGGVGSGVYIYAVTAKKGGHGDIRRIKRLAVVH